MKFYPIKSSDHGTADSGTGDIKVKWDLPAQYASARIIGSVRIADDVLFARSGLRTYYSPYTEIRNCFRRVIGVPMKMCCGKGEMAVEKLVISDGTAELAEIPLPGTRAALEVMKILEEKMPDCEFGYRGSDTQSTSDGRREA